MNIWNTVMNRKMAGIATALICTMGVLPERASAQDLAFITSTTSTTTAGVLTTVGVVWLVMPKDKAKQSAAQYMNHNQAIFCETLITGQGQALHDLASMSGVPETHHERFAQTLSEALAPHRATLLSAPVYTEEHASILLDAMQQSIEQDDTLRAASTLSM